MEQRQEHKCACGGNCACKTKKKIEIKKDMKIMDVVSTKPEASEVLYEIGLGCAGCMMSGFETLEQGCKGHGMSDEEVDEVVKMLNT